MSGSGWQPIETAPKDGTEILGYGRYWWQTDSEREPSAGQGKLGCAVIFWAVQTWISDGDMSHWALVHENLYEDWMIVTHWMPLPDPPTPSPEITHE